ncbi:MAG: 5'/3'-nucleotidase SurE [Phycisphaerales bacterium]|nr:5'/3'-nucleotidase SurE [Phycisphaerales bacterium]
MRILLTNDDGIHAPGIIAMHDALIDAPLAGKPRFAGPLLDSRDTASRAPRSVVYPIAPLTVQSATGHGVTFHQPLMVGPAKVNERMEGIAVDGRPADCVKLAIANLWPQKFGEGSRPDLVISGLNGGANCGINVIYSGTVAAAIEAAFLGVPSIAVSMRVSPKPSNFELGAYWARRTIEMLLRDGLPRPHDCLSINIPLTDDPSLTLESPMPPVRVCPMNTHGLVDRFERRVSPYGGQYYWASGHGLDFRGTERDSDVELLLAGNITVTPLSYDLTHRPGLEAWRERLESPGRR